MRRRPKGLRVCVDCGGTCFDRARTPGSRVHCTSCRSERMVLLDLKALAQAQYERDQVVFDHDRDQPE